MISVEGYARKHYMNDLPWQTLLLPFLMRETGPEERSTYLIVTSETPVTGSIASGSCNVWWQLPLLVLHCWCVYAMLVARDLYRLQKQHQRHWFLSQHPWQVVYFCDSRDPIQLDVPLGATERHTYLNRVWIEKQNKIFWDCTCNHHHLWEMTLIFA